MFLNLQTNNPHCRCKIFTDQLPTKWVEPLPKCIKQHQVITQNFDSIHFMACHTFFITSPLHISLSTSHTFDSTTAFAPTMDTTWADDSLNYAQISIVIGLKLTQKFYFVMA